MYFGWWMCGVGDFVNVINFSVVKFGDCDFLDVVIILIFVYEFYGGNFSCVYVDQYMVMLRKLIICCIDELFVVVDVNMWNVIINFVVYDVSDDFFMYV